MLIDNSDLVKKDILNTADSSVECWSIYYKADKVFYHKSADELKKSQKQDELFLVNSNCSIQKTRISEDEILQYNVIALQKIKINYFIADV